MLVSPHSPSAPVVASAAIAAARPVPTLSISAVTASTPVVSPLRSPAILLSSPTDTSPSPRELPLSTPPSPRLHDPIAGIAPISLNRPNKPKLLHVGSPPSSLPGHQLFADAVSARRPLPLPRVSTARCLSFKKRRPMALGVCLDFQAPCSRLYPLYSDTRGARCRSVRIAHACRLACRRDRVAKDALWRLYGRTQVSAVCRPHAFAATAHQRRAPRPFISATCHPARGSRVVRSIQRLVLAKES